MLSMLDAVPIKLWTVRGTSDASNFGSFCVRIVKRLRYQRNMKFMCCLYVREVIKVVISCKSELWTGRKTSLN
ncbi:hypothetical protein P8452_47367 [Trifolium repens]|nr:hypothetical protein P8452_47367 [Trifolium repens]